MRSKYLWVILIMVLLMGCATSRFHPSKFNNLSLGMTKSASIEILGTPHTTKASDKTEVLEYRYLSWPPYWVVLTSGKVTFYGAAGDFGTAMPSDRREYNLKIDNQ